MVIEAAIPFLKAEIEREVLRDVYEWCKANGWRKHGKPQFIREFASSRNIELGEGE